MAKREDRTVSISEVSQPPYARRWLALGVLLIAAFMDLLDATIVFVALPQIAGDLNAGFSAMEWVVAGYALSFAVGLITGGRLGDIYGRRKVFLIGITGFTLASVAAGLAPSAAVLVSARVVQGLMAAVMVPQVLSITQVIFPRAERVAAFALYGITLGLAAVAGPLLGGVLTQLDLAGLGWRPIFLINVPVGVAALVAAATMLPETRSSRPLRLDVPGMVLSAIAVFLLAFPLVEGRALGWPWWTFAAMLASVPALAGLALWERRKAITDRSPLVEPSLFRQSGFVAGLLVSVALLSSLGSFWFLLVIWLQVGLGYTPFETALVGLGSPIASMLVAGVAVKLAPRLGRRLLSMGFAISAGAVALFIGTLTLVGPASSGWSIVPALVLLGIGLGLVNPVLFDFVLAAVPHRDAGSASGVVHTVQQVASAIGIAIVGVIFFAVVPANAESAGRAVAPDVVRLLEEAGLPPSRARAASDSFVACFSDRASSPDPASNPVSCGNWEAVLSGLTSSQLVSVGPALDDAVGEALATTFGESITQTLWYHMLAYVAAFGLVFLMPRFAAGHEPEAGSADTPEAVAAIG